MHNVPTSGRYRRPNDEPQVHTGHRYAESALSPELPEYTAEQIAAMTPEELDAVREQAANAYIAMLRTQGPDPEMAEKLEALADEGFESIREH